MTTWVSFSSTWIAFFKGEINVSDTDCYAFGCDRRHLIRKDGLVPKEVTWVTSRRELIREAVPESELDTELLETWDAFKQILIIADKQKRVSYRIGNYPKYINTHPDAIWP